MDWTQQRQTTALLTALSAAKRRFPGMGGMIFWMGHDCFPCAANTAIIDLHGRPKPAALALAAVLRRRPGKPRE